MMQSANHRSILFISQAANLYGSERTLLTILEGPRPTHTEFVLMCPGSGPLVDRVKELAIEHIPQAFNKYSLARGPGWNIAFLVKLVGILRKLRPEAVVIGYEGNVPLIVLACRMTTTPVFRILQRSVFSRKSTLIPSPDNWAFNQCAGILCGGVSLKDQLLNNYHIKQNVDVQVAYLPLRAIDPEFGDSAAWRQLHAIPCSAPLVAQFSRIHPDKNVLGLIDIAEAVYTLRPDVHFVMCGGEDGSENARRYHSEIRQRLAGSCVRDQFHMTGLIDDVFTGMRAANVLILPSRTEGTPLSCLEGMLTGKPHVVSAVDGLNEIITASGGGHAVPFGDTQAFATALIALLSDSATATTMGAHAKRWVIENCSPEVFRKGFWNLYHQAFDKRKRRN